VVGGARPIVPWSPKNKHHVEDGMGEEVHVCAQAHRRAAGDHACNVYVFACQHILWACIAAV